MMKMKPSLGCALWVGLTLLVMPLDQMAHTWILTTPHGIVRDMLTVNDYLAGYSIQVLMIGILFAQENRRKLISGYLAVMLSQALFVEWTKILVGRARPMLEKGAFNFHPLNLPGTGMTSFPSGDASVAMALATLLGIYYPRSRWIFWTLAMAAGFARVARGRHFISDVVFGAGLGIVCVWLAMRCLGMEYFTMGHGKTSHGEKLPAVVHVSS